MFGKPGVEHFEACIDKLGLSKDRVAHVGDSLHHDIIGAINTNIPNIFITSGIHKHELNVKEFGILPEKDRLEELMATELGSAGTTERRPTHVVAAFRL